MQDLPHITLSAPHRKQQWTLTYGTDTNIPDEDIKPAKRTRTHEQRKATAATRQKQPNTTTNKRIPAVCLAQGKGHKNRLQNADANRHSH